MSKRDRGEGSQARVAWTFAIGALVVLAFCVGVWGWSQKAEYERDAQKHYEEYTTNTYHPQRDACLVPPAIDRESCLAKAQADARAYERDEQDLVAQKTTATWTVLMGGAAISGMILSVIGVGLVWTTFKATRDANEIARTASVNESQAYVQIKEVRWIESTEDIVFTFFVQNSGQTPCKQFEITVYLYVYRDGKALEGSKEPIVAFPKRWDGLSGNDTVTARIVPAFALPKDVVLGRRYDDRLFISGHVEYKTFYNDWFRSEFTFFGVGTGERSKENEYGKSMSRTPRPTKVFEPISRAD